MKKIIQNFSYVLLANIISAISKFILMIVITKILTIEELGQYTLALAITAPIALLFNMKMRAYIISSDNINFLTFKKLRNISNVFSIMSIIIISLLLYKDSFWIMLLVLIIKILDMNGEFYQGWPNKEKLYKKPAKLMILRVLGSTILFIVIATITRSLFWSLYSQVFFQFLFLIIEKHKNLQITNVKIEKVGITKVKLLFLTIFPLGVAQFLMSFASSIPKLLLDYSVNVEMVGIFSAITYLITVMNLFMNSLNQALLPYMKKIFIEKRILFFRTINMYSLIFSVFIGALFFVFTTIFGEYLLTVLYNETFGKYNYLLQLCSIILIFNISGWMYDSALLITNRLKFQPVYLAISTLITVIVGVEIVPRYQLLGACMTLIVFQFINTLLKALYFNFKFKKIIKEG
ncbi:lipopolysaccharide biosynthesis protein [Staphylococcus equorum]|uniref:lipopolysaccharide biosynthesis protein n=1 Tax=Staphylococcus equorum TaxID=246432 RepID=UPI002407F43D|nr:lipopolysaccharide biosynthesis protein [Staphylococcus equorum]MDG0826064.1 lipopolysaccharide biosynthesis protein [Staphylococcus equorum]MDK9850289.1 lipopolysaccharide biosynthesis protein [Staphylococcus equorum]